MALSARWEDLSGNPAPPPDFDEVPPGGTKTISRRLRNTGDLAFKVLATPEIIPGQPLGGWTVFEYGGTAVSLGQTYESAPVAPGDALEVTYTATVPPTATPGLPLARVVVACVPTP